MACSYLYQLASKQSSKATKSLAQTPIYSKLLSKSKSRRQFEKQGNSPILTDGSKRRRLGSKQELPESEQCLGLFQYHAANTVFYLCIGRLLPIHRLIA